MAHSGQRAIIAAMLANAGIAVAKFVGYAFTGAASLLAEGVHSVADTGNQALLLFGGRAALRAPTPEHPFGYGRERYFWAFVVALVIFSIGALFAIYEGVGKLLHPHELNDPSWAIGILVIAILLESWSFHTAVGEARQQKGKTSWWRFIRRSKSPELPVVILEDLGALLGLLIALLGVGLAVLTGDPRFDASGSIAIGLLLGSIAIVLAIEMKSLLIGESASRADQERLRRTILADAAVRRLIHMRTLHIGPDELLLAAKLEFDSSLSFARLAGTIDALETRIRAALPHAITIYIEPDVYREPESQDVEQPRQTDLRFTE